MAHPPCPPARSQLGPPSHLSCSCSLSHTTGGAGHISASLHHGWHNLDAGILAELVFSTGAYSSDSCSAEEGLHCRPLS